MARGDGVRSWLRDAAERVRDRTGAESTTVPMPSAPPRRKHPAQALTEFAVVAIAAVTLLLAVADLGRAFYEAQAMHQAVGSGALIAMDPSRATNCSTACSPGSAPCYSDTGVTCANDQVKCAITMNLPWGNGGDCRTPKSGDTITLSSPSNTAGPNWNATDWGIDQTFTITMTHNFTFVTPFINNAKTLTLRATITSERNPQ